MMGSPFYYDVLYDHGPGDVVFHDCMWSGICTCCIQLVHQDAHHRCSNDASPDIKVEELNYRTQTTVDTLDPRLLCLKVPVATPASTNNVPKAPDGDDTNIDDNINEPTTDCASSIKSEACSSRKVRDSTKNASSSSDQRRLRHREVETKSRHKQVHFMLKTTINERVPTKLDKDTKNTSTSADNKKLRHREVEKNRHRQLQAMVKTLSDRIPGRLDKETQVQTMKRAARYCVYLRDVLTTLSHGQTSMSKDKLDKIYRRSCDNVDLIMSQQ